MRAATGTLGQVVDSLDFDAMQAAGIADPRSRAGLIEYLAGLGFTVDEMAEAERSGRLFGLAGDVLLWSGPQIYTLRTAADSIGVTLEEVERGWAMLGLTVADPDTPALSQADVDGLATWVAMRMQMGPDAADGFLRVLGANVARVAEAISSMIRTSQPKMWLGLTGDELTTAQVYRERRRVRPPPRGNDRRRPPPTSGQHSNVHRGRRQRPVGEPGVRRRVSRICPASRR